MNIKEMTERGLEREREREREREILKEIFGVNDLCKVQHREVGQSMLSNKTLKEQ